MNPGTEPSLVSQQPHVARVSEGDTPDQVQPQADGCIEEPRESLEGADEVNGGEDHRQAAQNTLESSAIIEPFGGLAGIPVQGESLGPAFEQYQDQIFGGAYAPFSSRLDWEVARWAKLRGLGSTAFSDLLSIEGVVDALGLSFKNSKQLNDIIDKKLPSQRPAFTHTEVRCAGESFDLFSRDIIECVKAFYGDPEHSQYLCFTPERCYVDANKTEWLYHEMNTGKWWWATQKALEKDRPGAMIVPIILSSDKTQLTLFRNKSAYPVYLTIGNLPKSIRRKPSHRGQILLVYLPTSNLSHMTNKASRRRAMSNLFHTSMSHILKPLTLPGTEGLLMASGDGVVQRCYPIFAAYVGDYPEQCLVTGTYNGDSPVCKCPHNQLGLYPCLHPLRDMDNTFSILEHADQGHFLATCKANRFRPLRCPFWAGLPYVDIFLSIVPDVLHQQHQGVIKHLVSWVTQICTPAEVDARAERLPENHGIRIFHKGISSLSRLSGTEHKQISSFLLGLLIDAPIPASDCKRLIRSTRALLDFSYISQFPIHSTETLRLLDSTLSRFHNEKSIFIKYGIREHFNIPKIHSLAHYSRAITLFGATDNYSTESTECLHIDFAKDAYNATNHKDEYPQMTKWLERREKVMLHEKYIIWRERMHIDKLPTIATCNWTPLMSSPLRCKMTKHPSASHIPLSDITSPSGYHVPFFMASLSRFVLLLNHPEIAVLDLELRASHFSLPFTSLPVFHKIKFINADISASASETLDSIHVHPKHEVDNDKEIVVAPRFDVALVRLSPRHESDSPSSLNGLRVGRVRVVFSLPPDAKTILFPSGIEPPTHLAYIEWFSKFARSPDPNSGLYKISHIDEHASIIPVAQIERSVHLFPKWGGKVPVHWTSSNVLDICHDFYVNPFKDHHTYYNII
ncbi:hypothetical protein BDN71DRAFT_1405152 [Pleurotus eryngii]|uniref:Uncharacterized protein n=1 Tax=Pleurotus eryngii TaxID=5323 RepID=A0A9P5ZG63_PLEER|nr:hypothetical protein BDN71DRAFT_1405152 [Pleurotus eryngii]